MFIRLAVACLWCLSWLPFRVVGWLGTLLGTLLFLIPTERRRVGAINLQLCFPNLDAGARDKLLRQHFIALMQMMLEYGYCWFASRERLRRLVRIDGLEHLQALGADKAVILLMPHFTGIDLVGLRLSLETQMATMYSRQKDAWLDGFFKRKRERLGTGDAFSRQDGARAIIRALRQGLRLYYLPDQDMGTRESVFADFFGVPAATITGLSRLAGVTGAAVVPCRPLRQRDGYVLVIDPALQGFPSADAQADARRMNAVIEAQVLLEPHQYFWLHRRFKTRPPGQPPIYDRPRRRHQAAAPQTQESRQE